ncbi:MAG: hypothetical protein AAB578_10080 [Elusimicrobiota bacterium]
MSRREAAAILSLLLLPAGGMSAERMSGGSVMIARGVGDSGGLRAESQSVAFHHAIGEASVETFTGGGIKLQTGYLPLAAQPGSVTAITALSKSSGSLELAWTAPGLDGFRGLVEGGLYRVDYSSDPAHPFSPSVYRLQFSTRSVPGAAHSLAVGGLLPNTTYFARIYLADARRFFAGDCRTSAESTLAGAPLSPTVSAVSSTSITLLWQTPASGAEGFEALGSTTGFGALFPGGVSISASSASPGALTLTLRDLAPRTTYYFKLASLNWQGERNFVTVLPAFTRGSSSPLPIENLLAGVDALARTVRVSWANPVYEDPAGGVVLLSTHPAGPQVADGTQLLPGQALGDGSVVKSTALAQSFADSGLALDTTYYYHLFSQGAGNIYSISVSTRAFLDLPPMAPAGVAGSISEDRSRFTVRWKPVVSNADGSGFDSEASPKSLEVARYDIYRSTTLLGGDWVKVGTAPISAQEFTDALPDSGLEYVYKVVSVDAFGSTGTSLSVDTAGNIFLFAPDQVTRFQVPPHLAEELKGEVNGLEDVTLRTVEGSADPAQSVFRTVRFEALSSRTGRPLDSFRFTKPDATVALRYEVAAGRVAASAAAASAPEGARPASSAQAPAAASPGVPAAQAEKSLGLYWDNGTKYVKLYGKVDPTAQTVSVQGAMPGSYQIRSLVREQGFSFDLSTLSNKAITPNGDGLNDAAVLWGDNPKDSAYSGKIFDLSGAKVADMAQGPLSGTGTWSLSWDGKAGGRAVDGGVYVYQIRAEDKIFNGTLLVIR